MEGKPGRDPGAGCYPVGSSRSTDNRQLPATPPEILERQEVKRRVRRGLHGLPVAARTMLLLRDFEGFSYEDMAETLGCELGTVKSRLHRARRQFEELYNLSGEDDQEGSA